MKPQSGRFHLTWAEENETGPGETRVLFRQRVAGVMLLGAFLALLCLPAHRRMLFSQLRAVLQQQKPDWASFDPRAQQAHRERVQATVKRSPNDAFLALGVLGANGIELPPPQSYRPRVSNGISYAEPVPDPRIAYLETLRQRYPDNPVLVATELRYVAQSQLRGSRSAVDGAWGAKNLSDVVLAPVTVRMVEQLVAEGERLDPGNGYYRSILAAAYFQARRDREALSALREAAQRDTWKDHAFEEAFAGRDLLIRTYGDEGLWMHMTPLASVVLPHFVRLRQAARTAVWAAEQTGGAESPYLIRQDLMRLGHRMREDADTLIGRLVGRAIEQMAFSTPPGSNANPERSGQYTETRHKEQRAAYLDRIRHAAPRLAAYAEQEAEELDRISSSTLAAGQPDLWTAVMEATRYRETAGFFLLSNLLLTLAAWVAASGAWSFFSRRQRGPVGTEDWLWNGIRPGVRLAAVVVLLGATAIPLVLLAMVPGAGGGPVLLSLLALGLLMLPLRRRTRGGAIRESLRDGTLVTLATLGIAALATFPRQLSIAMVMGWWNHVSAGSDLVALGLSVPGFQPLGLLLLPAPVPGALLLAALLLTLRRRGTLASWTLGVRIGARAVTGVLAAAYLVYLLYAAAADTRQTQRFDQSVLAEVNAVSNR